MECLFLQMELGIPAGARPSELPDSAQKSSLPVATVSQNPHFDALLRTLEAQLSTLLPAPTIKALTSYLVAAQSRT